MVSGESPELTLPQLILLFSAGAVLVMAAQYIARSLIIKILEPAGKWLDRWRRHGFEPERDLALVFGNGLILVFVAGFAERYGMPDWALFLLFGVWALHLPRDAANFLRNRGGSPVALHRRGFFLFHYGPLRVRALLGLAAVADVLGLELLGFAARHPAALLLGGLERLLL